MTTAQRHTRPAAMDKPQRFWGRMTLLARGAVLGGALLLAACADDAQKAQDHYERGLELQQAGELEKASLEFRSALQLDETKLEARVAYADILAAQRDLRGAVGNYLVAIEADPKLVRPRVKLAEIMLFANDQDAALTHSSAAFAEAPEDPEVLAIHASVLFRSDERDEGVELAKKALAARPGLPLAGSIMIAETIRIDGYEAAIAYADELIAANTEEKDILNLQLAKLGLIERGRSQEAMLTYLEELSTAYPANIGIQSALGAAYAKLGKTEKAEQSLRDLIPLGDDSAQASMQLARYVYSTKGYDAARAVLAERIAAEEDNLDLKLSLAELDFRSGEPGKARAALEALVEEADDIEERSKLRLSLARYAVSEQDFDRAKSLIETVLAEDEKNVGALAIQASFALDAGDTSTALEIVRRGLSESPNNLALLRITALAYARDGRLELAKNAFGKAVQASNYETSDVMRYARALREAGERAPAEIVLSEAERRRPGRAEVLSALAQVRLELGQWTAAEEAAAALRNAQPDADTADQIFAASLVGQQRFAEGIDLLTSLAERNAQSERSVLALISAYARAERFDDARAVLEKRAADAPGDPFPLLLLARLEASQRNTDAAAERFKQAIAAAPEDLRGYAGLSQLYRQSGDLDQAEAVIREGSTSVDNDAALKLQLAVLMEQRGDVAAAIAEYRTLYEKNPTSIVIANNLASLLTDHQSDDPAVLELAKQIAEPLKGSQVPAFQDTYGWILYLNGDYEGAVEKLRSAIEGLPENPWVNFHLGMTYAKLNETSGARQHLEKAIALGAASGFTKVDAAQAALSALPE